nr:3B [rabbit kobuvirus]
GPYAGPTQKVLRPPVPRTVVAQ